MMNNMCFYVDMGLPHFLVPLELESSGERIVKRGGVDEDDNNPN